MEFVERIFSSVFQSSLTAGVVILVVILILKVFSNHLSVRIKNALWILVLLKLLMPIIPETNINLLNILYEKCGNALQTQSEVNNLAEISTQAKIREESLNDISSNKANAKIDTKIQDDSNKFLMPYIFEKASIIWLIGLLISSLALLIANFNLKRKTEKLKYNIDAEVLTLIKECRLKANIKSRIPVYVYDRVKSPCTLGIIRPRIYIPKYVLNIKEHNELSHIFLHELIHYKRKDLIYNFLSIVALLIHWFNPLVWIAIKKMRLYRECACDACVLELLNEEENTEYGMTLLKLSRLNSNKGCYSPMPVFFETRNQIKDRIWMIKGFKKGSYKLTVKAALGCTMAGFIIFTNNLAVKALSEEKIILPTSNTEELKEEKKFEVDDKNSDKESMQNAEENNDKNDSTSINRGWVKNSGKWYYYDNNGEMLKNTVKDGYVLGEDGALTYKTTSDNQTNDTDSKSSILNTENKDGKANQVSNNSKEKQIQTSNPSENSFGNRDRSGGIEQNRHIVIDPNNEKYAWNQKGNGKWYLINENGSKETGLVSYGNAWFYLNKDGVLQLNTSVTLDDGKSYKVKDNGQIEVLS